MDWIDRWWRQPDHYRWLSSYLAAHEFQRFTRFMMAAIVAALAAVPLLMVVSASVVSGPVFTATAITVSASCGVMAIMWLTRWPTQAQSTAFAIVACGCIAAVCLAQPSPGSAVQGCAAFAAIAGYVAFFHSSRLLALTLAIAGVTATISAIRVGMYVDVPLAMSKMIVLTVSILAVPFSAQVLVQLLGIDALKSDTDPLTDLPNRRGFHRSVRVLVANSLSTNPARLAIVMVDLDDFKLVNDTHGHAAGDRILVAVGDILRNTGRSEAVIARIGGEEFVLAVVGEEHNAIALAERLRAGIAGLPGRVTASIGVASAGFARVPEAEIRTFAEALVETADRAMYEAKRAGGDRIYAVGRAGEGYVVSPSANSTTATSGNVPWTAADRALSGDDAISTIAAASMDPTPAKTSAAPTAIPPELIHPIPTPATIAKKRL